MVSRTTIVRIASLSTFMVGAVCLGLGGSMGITPLTVAGIVLVIVGGIGGFTSIFPATNREPPLRAVELRTP